MSSAQNSGYMPAHALTQTFAVRRVQLRMLYLLFSVALQEVIEALWVERTDRPGQISAKQENACR